MEHASHPCHQCNAEVEEGTPFCRHCGAPQIRVSHESGTEQRTEPATDSGSVAAPVRFASERSIQKGLDRRLARWLAVLSGLLLAIIISFSSASFLALLFVPVPGALTVWLYLRRYPGQSISLGVGTGLGLLTGFFGALIYIVPSLSFILWSITYHPEWRPAQELRSQIENAIQNNPSPQLHQMAPFLLSHSGLVFLAIMGSAVLLVLTLILSAIGGAIGAALFSRQR